MRKRVAGILLLVMFFKSFNVYASDEVTLTIAQAVEEGLEKSITIDKIKNQAELANLVNKNASKNKNDIYNAENELANASRDLSNGRSEVYSSLDQLDSAQAALDNGIAPMDIPIKDPTTGEVVMVIPKGSPIPDEQIIHQIQAQLDANKSKINSALEKLDDGTQEYLSSKAKYDLGIQFAMTNVANKLSTSTISSLSPTAVADLVVEMADKQERITHYSVHIYKNQIAMQIQNSYYEVLKHKKLLEAKEKALDRGKLQYDYAVFAYEVGAKSKDDVNFAKLYYDGIQMAYELQKKDYHNAMTELKKNMNIRLDTNINVVEEPMALGSTFELTQGINSGLRTRLEIKMAEAQVDLYKALRTAVDRSYYKQSDNQYKEAELLIDKAQIGLKEAQLQVESSIRMSYETMSTMQRVMNTANQLKESAEQAVEIAKLKYEVGFGADNALLKNLNLQDLSGTMVEVIAAEENLASVEAKVIEATNGYNLARIKYLNDIGVLPYN